MTDLTMLYRNPIYKVIQCYIRKVVDVMALKSSNVAARVEPEIKERAEEILSTLGISASSGINMFYRQVILWNGLPFRPSIPSGAPKSLEDMTREEFDNKLHRALNQSKSGEGMSAESFFDSLEQEIIDSYVG